MDVSGAELARSFAAEVVEPLLDRVLPGLPYATARLGSGSDVLGLDDAMSRDHDWGCRLTLLVDDGAPVARIVEVLEEELPRTFHGRPVRFPVTWDAAPTHNVETATVGDFAAGRLGVDPLGGLSARDWLCLTGQSVLEVTAGPVFTDRTTTLARCRQTLRWYPPDVERYVLAAGWRRLAQQLPFVGRTAERGDELGSRLLCAELAADVISLAFALSRRWSPYAKWRGTAFATLPIAGRLDLERAVSASGWEEREQALADAAEALLDLQRQRSLPAPARAVTPFWERPYRTIDEAVVRGLMAEVTDPEIRGLPPAGSVEQWASCVDVLSHAGRRASLRDVYERWSRPPALFIP
ncbi:DUF4037 domain-containing protein [Actinoallomurus acaciae]|uniref:DUF4037 domain-containing protein n=1 Tax=Actinoallomurus acaciae TaxID=502577 RepID=A0ABV5Y9V8_9ACTN